MFAQLRQFLFGEPEPAKPGTPQLKPISDPNNATPLASPESLAHLLVMETVVDHHGKAKGKFIRLRHGSRQHVPEHSQHADTVLLESLIRVLNSMPPQQNRVLLVELGASSLPHPIMDMLAARKAVLLLAHSPVPPSAQARLAQLRQEGLHLALWLPAKWPNEVLELADGFVFSFEGRSPIEAAELVETIRHRSTSAALIVVDIGWREEYAWCKRIGCHYAAGKLFQSPTWPEGPLDPGFVRVLDTLNKVRQEADPQEIALTMKSDPLLTFRLLAQANSAAQGLGRKVESIEQAVVVVGRGRLYRWLVLLLYATGQGSEDGPVLQEMAQVRAELMIRLGERYLPGEGEGLYLTGLFSLLEPLMQRPLALILADVDVSASVKDALLRQEGPYAPFLALAKAAEQNEPPSRDLLAVCGINPTEFNRCLLEVLMKTEAAEQETAAAHWQNSNETSG